MYNLLKYSVNTINKKHLNIPRCRINPKKKDLEFHVVPWVLLSGLKTHGPWSSQPLKELGPGFNVVEPQISSVCSDASSSNGSSSSSDGSPISPSTDAEQQHDRSDSCYGTYERGGSTTDV